MTLRYLCQFFLTVHLLHDACPIMSNPLLTKPYSVTVTSHTNLKPRRTVCKYWLSIFTWTCFQLNFSAILFNDLHRAAFVYPSTQKTIGETNSQLRKLQIKKLFAPQICLRVSCRLTKQTLIIQLFYFLTLSMCNTGNAHCANIVVFPDHFIVIFR